MATIQLSSLLSPTPTAGGTWTDTGTLTGPTAPVLWDGTIDFSGFADGLYEYTYTVTPVGTGDDAVAVVTINVSTGIPLNNDECAGALASLIREDGTTSATKSNQSMAGDCGSGGQVAATDSGETIPGTWPAGTYSDMWYYLTVEISSATAELAITVDSSAYSSPLINPTIAVYSGTCGALVLETSVGPASTNVAATSQILTTGTYDFYVRVGGLTANKGKFTITYTIL